MDRHAFFARWVIKLPLDDHDAFLEELAVLLTAEQARERRRLTTDRQRYEQACAQTARELRRA